MRRVLAWLRAEWPLIAAFLLWIPLWLQITPFRVPLSSWFWHVPLVAVAVVGWRRISSEAPRPGPITLRIGILRSVFTLLLLPGATFLHLLAGGGAFFVPTYRFMGTTVVFSLLAGPLALFEHHAVVQPRRRGGDVSAAVLTGWGAFLILCAGWVQVDYLDEMISSGHVGQLAERVMKRLNWLLESPLWTLVHFGWAVVPVGAFVLVRLRGGRLTEQIAISLGAAGGLWWAFSGMTPIVTFGLSAFAIGFPLVAALADRFGKQAALAEDPREPLGKGWWRAGVAACLLWALVLGGRAVYRPIRLESLKAETDARRVTWGGALKGDRWEGASVASLQSDVAAVVSLTPTARAGRLQPVTDEVKGYAGWVGVRMRELAAAKSGVAKAKLELIRLGATGEDYRLLAELELELKERTEELTEMSDVSQALLSQVYGMGGQP